MSARNSTIIIATGINIDKNYNNTLALSQADIQALCSSNAVYSGSDYSFLRTEDRIKVQAPFSQIFNANYCVIINQGVRQFFFIDEVKYIADATTEIRVTEDVITTYKHLGFRSVFVERQHTQNDNIPNLANETINFERFVRNELTEIDVTPIKVCAEYSEYMEEDGTFYRTTDDRIPAPERGGMVNTGLPYNVPSMMYRHKGYMGDEDTSATVTLNTQGLENICDTAFAYNAEGHGSSLLGVKTYPRAGRSGTTVSALTSLDGYTPKNNKCLQYPYYYINLSNNAGKANVLKPEMFDSSNGFVFQTDTCVQGVPNSFCYPKFYNKQDNAIDFGVNINNFPQLPMTVDSYSGYLAQRGSEAMAGVAGSGVVGAVGLVAGLATGNPIAIGGAVASLAQSAASAISSVAFQPDNKGDGVVGRASADFLNLAIGMFKFRIEQMTVTSQDAKRIDDYFSAYGYAQNEIQAIQTTNPRFHCHYVKTLAGEAVIEGIPHAKADIINNAFAKGITFWDSNDSVGNYNLK